MAANMNSTADIMGLVTFANEAFNGSINPELFYQKQLLDTIRMDEINYVYFRLAETAPIGDKADKLVLRRWSPLKAHTVPLTEGIPPKSDKGTVFKYELEAKQYGRYMEFTDKVSFKFVDPIVAMYTKEYSLVVMETLDMLAREALLANCSKYFAGGVANEAGIITANEDDVYPNMKPTLDDLRRIVLSMKRNQIKPRSNGRYHVIGSPEFTYDMIDDPYVKRYMEINQTTGTMYDGSVLVPLFGMEFYETLECPTTGAYVDGTTKKCLQIATATSVPTASTTSANNTAEYVRFTDAYTQTKVAANGTLDGTEGSYIPGGAYTVFTFGAGNVEYKLQHILVLGNNALYRTGLQGEDNAKVYVKPLGSAGVLDPIDQRQSIGFKINSVGFAVLDSRAVVDYICVPTTVNSYNPPIATT